MTNEIMQQNQVGEILEKVIINNDISALSPIEKVKYIAEVCQSVGLNPLTRPIQLIKFQGKEIPYFTKDATDQLRKIYNVSITKLDTSIINGNYIVTVYAQLPNGRTDASTAAIHIANLKGDALCNAIMKTESKAKRRVTLSICGLGILSEEELDTMKGFKEVDLEKPSCIVSSHDAQEQKSGEFSTHEEMFQYFEREIANSKSLDELKNTFEYIKLSSLLSDRRDLFEILIQQKDDRKAILQDLAREINP